MNERMPSAENVPPVISQKEREEMYGGDVTRMLESLKAVAEEKAIKAGIFVDTDTGRKWPIDSPEILALAASQWVISEVKSRLSAAENQGEYYYAKILAKEHELLELKHRQLKIELDIADISPQLAEFNFTLPTTKEQLAAANDNLPKREQEAA